MNTKISNTLETRLLQAAEEGDRGFVKYLLKAGANINYRHCQNQYTALHFASEKGWVEIVQYLLKKGADIQVKARGGHTPLLLAAKERQRYIVKLLIDAGANVHHSHCLKQYTVLHYACENGWPDIVESLLRRGADIQERTRCGHTPLLLAAKERQRYIVKLLIDVGANIYQSHCLKQYTVLHYASENGWNEIVQCLLEKGADIQVKTKCGDTPLLLAAKNDRKGLVDMLINEVTDINWAGGSDNYTVLHLAIGKGWHDTVQSLLKKEVRVGNRRAHADSPLLLAALYHHRDVVSYLIHAGADIRCFFSWNGYTALHFAAGRGWLEVVVSLLERGADIEAKSAGGETPLQKALDYKKTNIAEYLINAGADVNVESINGNSPMSSVIRTSPNIELVGLLIRRGSYLKTVHYETMVGNSLLKEHVLQDIELCSQAIINKFNRKDLPELYKLSVVCEILPHIAQIRMGGSNSQATCEVKESVKHDIQTNGHCNVLKVCHKNLKMLAAKSFLSHCDYVKKQAKQMKRLAKFDYDNQQSSTINIKVLKKS